MARRPLSHWHFHTLAAFFWSLVLFNWSKPMKKKKNPLQEWGLNSGHSGEDTDHWATGTSTLLLLFFGVSSCLIGQNQWNQNNFSVARVRLKLGSLRHGRGAQTTEPPEWRHAVHFNFFHLIVSNSSRFWLILTWYLTSSESLRSSKLKLFSSTRSLRLTMFEESYSSLYSCWIMFSGIRLEKKDSIQLNATKRPPVVHFCI